MENSEFLWQSVSVALVVGNVLQAWLRIKSHGKPQSVDVSNQPLEVVEGRQPATMDHVKVLHHRLDDHGRRLGVLETVRETDKRDVVAEIIKMREQSHVQFATLNRAIGRMEGIRLQD